MYECAAHQLDNALSTLECFFIVFMHALLTGFGGKPTDQQGPANGKKKVSLVVYGWTAIGLYGRCVFLFFALSLSFIYNLFNHGIYPHDRNILKKASEKKRFSVFFLLCFSCLEISISSRPKPWLMLWIHAIMMLFTRIWTDTCEHYTLGLPVSMYLFLNSVCFFFAL